MRIRLCASFFLLIIGLAALEFEVSSSFRGLVHLEKDISQTITGKNLLVTGEGTVDNIVGGIDSCETVTIIYTKINR